MAGRVRVLSERLMRSGQEGTVRDVMDRVVARVRRQPGFVSGDVLRDAHSPDVCALRLRPWRRRGGGGRGAARSAARAVPAVADRRAARARN